MKLITIRQRQNTREQTTETEIHIPWEMATWHRARYHVQQHHVYGERYSAVAVVMTGDTERVRDDDVRIETLRKTYAGYEEDGQWDGPKLLYTDVGKLLREIDRLLSLLRGQREGRNDTILECVKVVEDYALNMHEVATSRHDQSLHEDAYQHEAAREACIVVAALIRALALSEEETKDG